MPKQAPQYPVRDIPIREIDRSRNYRIPEPDDATRLTSLAESIKAGGQLQDVRVYERGDHQKEEKHDERFILGFGTRSAWVELAGWTKQGDPDYRDQIGLIHPDALMHLADVIGVKLPKVPTWAMPSADDVSKATPVA